jgi:hypothetical protein
MHQTIMRESTAARGIDRHMLALRVLASEKPGAVMPAVFRNPVFAASSKWRLSTSNMSPERNFVAGFGAVEVRTSPSFAQMKQC